MSNHLDIKNSSITDPVAKEVLAKIASMEGLLLDLLSKIERGVILDESYKKVINTCNINTKEESYDKSETIKTEYVGKKTSDNVFEIVHELRQKVLQRTARVAQLQILRESIKISYKSKSSERYKAK